MHNLGGGRIHPLETVQELASGPTERVGHAPRRARLFNAVVATGIEASRWGSLFDSVSVFSKG